MLAPFRRRGHHDPDPGGGEREAHRATAATQPPLTVEERPQGQHLLARFAVGPRKQSHSAFQLGAGRFPLAQGAQHSAEANPGLTLGTRAVGGDRVGTRQGSLVGGLCRLELTHALVHIADPSIELREGRMGRRERQTETLAPLLKVRKGRGQVARIALQFPECPQGFCHVRVAPQLAVALQRRQQLRPRRIKSSQLAQAVGGVARDERQAGIPRPKMEGKSDLGLAQALQRIPVARLAEQRRAVAVGHCAQVGVPWIAALTQARQGLVEQNQGSIVLAPLRALFTNFEQRVGAQLVALWQLDAGVFEGALGRGPGLFLESALEQAESEAVPRARARTLQPTALVNEAYLKLIDQRSVGFESRGRFLAIASTAMRRGLFEHARARLAEKRGAGAERVELFEVASALDETPEAILALESALESFAAVDPLNARIVELRWFAGLDVDATAAILEVSPCTVERGWRAARAWLRERVESELG
mgnify:CR=1 FL=1